jgi:hypothetical protein
MWRHLYNEKGKNHFVMWDPQAKTDSSSIGSRGRSAFGKENNMLWFIPIIIFTFLQ